MFEAERTLSFIALSTFPIAVVVSTSVSASVIVGTAALPGVGIIAPVRIVPSSSKPLNAVTRPLRSPVVVVMLVMVPSTS